MTSWLVTDLEADLPNQSKAEAKVNSNNWSSTPFTIFVTWSSETT